MQQLSLNNFLWRLVELFLGYKDVIAFWSKSPDRLCFMLSECWIKFGQLVYSYDNKWVELSSFVFLPFETRSCTNYDVFLWPIFGEKHGYNWIIDWFFVKLYTHRKMTRWNCRRPLGPREGRQDHHPESLLLYLHWTNPFIMAFALTVDKGHSLTLPNTIIGPLLYPSRKKPKMNDTLYIALLRPKHLDNLCIIEPHTNDTMHYF